MDMNQLLRALGLQQAYQAYQQNIGQPFANVAGPFGRGLLGLDKPEYGEEQAYRTGQAVGNMPAVSAPVGAFKAAVQAPELFGLLGSVAPKMGAKVFDLLGYQGSHKPPAPDYGAPLNDLTKIMPKDVYTREGKNLYGQGDPVVDREWWMAAMKAKNNPDFEVEIYRAVPKGVKGINSGDWVTTSKKYAEMHGESALSGDYEIISKKVKAKNLYTAGDPQEYGFFD
jgi:hypothetical protein